MNIAFITPTLDIGGYEKFLLNIIQEIRESHSIYLIAERAEGGYRKSFFENCNLVDLNVKKARYMIKSLYKKSSIIKPEYVYVAFSHHAVIVTLIKKMTGLKYKIIIGEHLITESKGAVQKKILKLVYENADDVIAVSNFTQNKLVENLGLKKDRIKVIYNPIINNNFKKNFRENFEHKWLSNNYISIVLLGRIEKDKGFQFVLQAFSKVKDKKNIRIICIGDGAYREELVKLAKELKISEYIDFVGFVNNPIKILKQADSLICMSDYETFGNTIVEALYCSCKIITYKGVGGPEEIINDKIATIIERRDVDLIVEEISKIKKKKIDINKISAANEFSIDKIIDKYNGVFETKEG